MVFNRLLLIGTCGSVVKNDRDVDRGSEMNGNEYPSNEESKVEITFEYIE